MSFEAALPAEPDAGQDVVSFALRYVTSTACTITIIQSMFLNLTITTPEQTH